MAASLDEEEGTETPMNSTESVAMIEVSIPANGILRPMLVLPSCWSVQYGFCDSLGLNEARTLLLRFATLN